MTLRSRFPHIDIATRTGFTFRYAMIGGVNTVLGLSLFPILQTVLGPLGIHYLVTLCLAQLVCVSTSFYMLRRFVFHAPTASLAQFLVHSAFYWVYLLFNLALLPLIVTASHSDPRLVQFLISVIAMVLAYIWQTRIVFKGTRGKS